MRVICSIRGLIGISREGRSALIKLIFRLPPHCKKIKRNSSNANASNLFNGGVQNNKFYCQFLNGGQHRHSNNFSRCTFHYRSTGSQSEQEMVRGIGANNCKVPVNLIINRLGEGQRSQSHSLNPSVEVFLSLCPPVNLLFPRHC